MAITVKDEIEISRIAAMAITVKDGTEIVKDDMSEFVSLSDETIVAMARGFGIHLVPQDYPEETMAAISRGFSSISATPEHYPIRPPDSNALPPGWKHGIPGYRAVPGDWTALPPTKTSGTCVAQVPPLPQFDVPVPNVDDVPFVTAPMSIPPGWKILPSGWQVLPMGWSYVPRGLRVFPPSWRLYPDDWQIIPPC